MSLQQQAGISGTVNAAAAEPQQQQFAVPETSSGDPKITATSLQQACFPANQIKKGNEFVLIGVNHLRALDTAAGKDGARLVDTVSLARYQGTEIVRDVHVIFQGPFNNAQKAHIQIHNLSFFLSPMGNLEMQKKEARKGLRRPGDDSLPYAAPSYVD